MTDTTKQKTLSLDAARAVIAQHEADAAAAAAAAAEAAEAERTRQDERRKVWAAHYIAAGADREASEAAEALSAARIRFRDALAAEPWVAALSEWQAAHYATHAVNARRAAALRALGHTGVSEPTPAQTIVSWRDGVPAMPDLFRALAAIIETPDNPMSAVDALVSAPDGEDDAMVSIRAAEAERAERVKADPLARLTRYGANRVEVTTYDDGTQMHQSLDTGEWVRVGKDGRALSTSWARAAKAEGQAAEKGGNQ